MKENKNIKIDQSIDKSIKQESPVAIDQEIDPVQFKKDFWEKINMARNLLFMAGNSTSMSSRSKNKLN